MKNKYKIILALYISLVCPFIGLGQKKPGIPSYYQEDIFKINPQRLYVFLQDINGDEDITEICPLPIPYKVSKVQEDVRAGRFLGKKVFHSQFDFSEKMTLKQQRKIMQILEKNEKVRLVNPRYDLYVYDEMHHRYYDTVDAVVGNFVSIMLKEEKDSTILKEICVKYGMKMEPPGKWEIGYKLHCDKYTKLSVMDMAKKMHSSKKFKSALPTVYGLLRFTCNGIDGLFNPFPSAWALYNANNPSTDINACEAWETTKGSPNIKIAIIDSGVDYTHPELQNALLPGYNVVDNTITNINNNTLYNSHGNACASIIGAAHNAQYMSGLAPDSKILPIALDEYHNDDNDAKAINYAVDNGASIISNSWTVAGATSSSLSKFYQAVQNAIANGRGGLGCVLFFGSGNYDVSTEFPAKLSEVMAVGATNKNGYRWQTIPLIQGSSYGIDLDIVAPGEEVQALGLKANNGTGNVYAFTGTSAATPYVAATASLMLSINPCMRERYVRDMIERSAQKLTTYAFGNNSAHPNGTWNNEIGHGLLDAYKALEFVKTMHLQARTINSTTNLFNIGSIRIGRQLSDAWNTGDFWVTNNAVLQLKATESITIEDGFLAEAGTDVKAYIDTYSGNCTNWTSSILEENPVKEKVQDTEASSLQITPSSFLMGKVNLYPNPFKNSFIVDFENHIENKFKIEVYDVYGKNIYRYEDFLERGRFVKTIDITGIPAVYFVKVQIGNSFFTSKLIKYE